MPNKRGGKRQGAGRKPKPKVMLKADTGIATSVFAALGTKLQFKVRDANGSIVNKQLELPCERDYWLVLLADKDPRLRFDVMKYLTDRRDGKPAQGIFAGDTREKARELDFGDLPELIASGKSVAAGKPN